MHGKSGIHSSLLSPLMTALVVILFVLLAVIVARPQNPVPPTARESATLPKYAAKLHPTTRPNKSRATAPARGTFAGRQSSSCSNRYSPADGGFLYENGPVNGTTDAWTINYGYIVSDTFVPNNSPVNGFDLGVWEFPGDTITSLQWSVTSGPNSGTIYGSGTVSGSDLTDQFISTNQYGYNIDKISATGLNVNLASGQTYWINLQNASVPSGDPAYWDENSGVGCQSQGCPSQAYDSGVGTIASEAFDIAGCGPYGCTPPPPSCYGSSGKFQVIHNFTQQEGILDFYYPQGGVTIDKAGNLYGTIPSGGGNSQGLAYELSPKGQGWVLDPLYSFLGGSSGSYPSPVTVGPGAVLYGTASGGIQNCTGGYCGLVFSLRPRPTACLTALCSWMESVLYEPAGDNDASDPGNLVFDAAGNLYGTASGGIQNCEENYCGTIFQLTPSNGGWTEKVIYEFQGGSDGGEPTSLLVGNDGNLYGTAGGCDGSGCGYGEVFQLVRAGGGWTKNVLYSFQDSANDGYAPSGLIQDGAGNLYGLSFFGSGGPDGGTWIVFMLSPSNGKWVFTEVSGQTEIGFYGGINNLTIDAAGNLYGTAMFYQYVNCGIVIDSYIFKLVPQGSGWQFIYLVPFGDEWFSSGGPLALDAQGNLYGTASGCGNYPNGTVWELSPQVKCYSTVRGRRH